MKAMKIQGKEWQALERLPDELWGHWQARQGVRVRRNRVLVALSVAASVTMAVAVGLRHPAKEEMAVRERAAEPAPDQVIELAYADDDWLGSQVDAEEPEAEEEPQAVAALFETPSFPELDDYELNDSGE